MDDQLNKMFSMRLFTINYYMVKPEVNLDPTYSDFRCLEVKQVPVLRVFGVTSKGFFVVVEINA